MPQSISPSLFVFCLMVSWSPTRLSLTMSSHHVGVTATRGDRHVDFGLTKALFPSRVRAELHVLVLSQQVHILLFCIGSVQSEVLPLNLPLILPQEIRFGLERNIISIKTASSSFCSFHKFDLNVYRSICKGSRIN